MSSKPTIHNSSNANANANANANNSMQKAAVQSQDSIQKFVATFSGKKQDAAKQKAAIVLFTRLVENKDDNEENRGLGMEVIERGALDHVLRLPSVFSSEVGGFLSALASSSEEVALALVKHDGVLDAISFLVNDELRTMGILAVKALVAYIGPVRDAIRARDDIVAGICATIAEENSTWSLCVDAIDVIADLARGDVGVQTAAGACIPQIMDVLVQKQEMSEHEVRSSVIAAITSILEKHYENQMKFVEVLASDDAYVNALLSKDNGVQCIRAAIRHPNKTSAQRTRLCKIDRFRKIVVEKCGENDDAYKRLLLAVCCGHSGNCSRFVSDGYVFPEELAKKVSYGKRKADQIQTDPVLKEEEVAPGAPVVVGTPGVVGAPFIGAPVVLDSKTALEVRCLEIENKMLRAELEDMRRRHVTLFCQQ